MFRTLLRTAVAVTWMLMGPAVAASQELPDGVGWLRATRGELEARLLRLEQLIRSGTAGDQELSRSHAAVAAVRARLAQGDFQAGDRVALAVESRSESPDPSALDGRPLEQQLSDTFTVGAGQDLVLPVVGRIPLRGVLRSELETRLGQAIGRFVRDPKLRAWAVVRLSVQGGVARPGYYSLPTDAVVSDALMAAGGPGPDAQIERLRIERGGKAIWEGQRLQRAIAAGSTLAGIGVQAGDQLVLPRRGGTERTLRILALVVSIPAAIFALTRF